MHIDDPSAPTPSPALVVPNKRMSALLNRARQASPPVAGDRSKYAHLVPVVSTLRSGGFSLSDAVAWLINEKEIPENRKASAYRSLRQILIRRSEKSAGGTATE